MHFSLQVLSNLIPSSLSSISQEEDFGLEWFVGENSCMSDVGRTNAVAATQQMVDLFDIKGIIHFGIAGNTNNSLSIGDVTIPNQIAHTGLWEWLNTNGTLDSADVAQLEIGDNIVPKGNGTNLLGHIGYMEEEY
ncbi:hypothetical protein PVK06_036337 [Gossypium arboreum]|uniref:Nucleoside phosphorylase domain-containing protein n=1 Tax=Gossypium arboreum TaxID=29729 RepID=A0ABR0NJ94_GOSAR|nr:hypothetical protein PVK06_036337 [Gossypium arboreum]